MQNDKTPLCPLLLLLYTPRFSLSHSLALPVSVSVRPCHSTQLSLCPVSPRLFPVCLHVSSLSPPLPPGKERETGVEQGRMTEGERQGKRQSRERWAQSERGVERQGQTETQRGRDSDSVVGARERRSEGTQLRRRGAASVCLSVCQC